jgi:predicted DsbA family dithiol-disulfide isomerase
VGLDRSNLLRELGVSVITLPLEIHPEIPVGGLPLADRWKDRYGEAMAMYERIEAECEAAGLPFRRPERVPNTRRALETAEWVRHEAPEAVLALERSLFEAHFVDNRPLDDPDVVDELVTAAGADAAAARQAVESGVVRPAMQAVLAMARRIGITGTPAWVVDGKVLIPGAVPRDVFRSVVSELASGETA